MAKIVIDTCSAGHRFAHPKGFQVDCPTCKGVLPQPIKAGQRIYILNSPNDINLLPKTGVDAAICQKGHLYAYHGQSKPPCPICSGTKAIPISERRQEDSSSNKLPHRSWIGKSFDYDSGYRRPDNTPMSPNPNTRDYQRSMSTMCSNFYSRPSPISGINVSKSLPLPAR